MTEAFASPEAFAASVHSRLKTKAALTGRPFNELEREFVMQVFLGRVFADPASPWILKGAGGLLVRLPGARHSVDLDLLNPAHSLGDAVAELTELGRPGPADPYVFSVQQAAKMTGGVQGAQVKVDVLLGGRRVARFPIDVSTELSIVGRVDHQRPERVIEVPGLADPPVVVLYPLPDQVADKVCAMYERHGPDGSIGSTRYRDLVDLVLIITSCQLDGQQTRAALAAESGRRSLTLPTALRSPGSGWASEYPRIARKSTLAPDLQGLEGALTQAGRCLSPLLAGELTGGRWDPRRSAWRSAAPTPAERTRAAFPQSVEDSLNAAAPQAPPAAGRPSPEPRRAFRCGPP